MVTMTTASNSFTEIPLSVCVVCRMLIAYGEYDDGTDSAEKAAEGITRIWGKDQRHLIVNGDELGHCVTSCDACGDTTHGDRYSAVALIPKNDA